VSELRIAFIGCVEISESILKHLTENLIPGCQIVGIVTKDESKINSDFVSLEPLGASMNIPVHLYNGDLSAMANWLRSIQPDVIYCFGWSHLLPADILQIPVLGVIGYHPAALPMNRGRHPIIWALVLGLEATASTFFFMDEGADSGDILSQDFVVIDPEDDARTLYMKLTETAKKQVIAFTQELMNGTYVRKPQNHQLANYWRKRTKADGCIDWRMGADQIHNLVRALTKPYPGAHCTYRGEEIKIWKTKVRRDLSLNHLEPGKIVEVVNEEIHVKCGMDILVIIEHEFSVLPSKGEYL
jgi:methionyl-tRNA formyltransferase